jgi:hypothetical protein
MAEAVVDPLEMIEVEEQQGRVLTRGPARLLDFLHQLPAVGEAGDMIAKSAVMRPLLRIGAGRHRFAERRRAPPAEQQKRGVKEHRGAEPALHRRRSVLQQGRGGERGEHRRRHKRDRRAEAEAGFEAGALGALRGW